MNRSSASSRLPVLLLFLLVAQSGALVPVADARQPAVRPVRLADFHSLARVSDLIVSPDGRRLVYRRSLPDRPTDAWVSELWEIDRGSGRERRLARDGSRPAFSPDGRWLSWIRDGEVWLLPLAGGEAWQLTETVEPVTDHAWAPDGNRMVIVTRDAPRRVPESLPLEAAPSELAAGSDDGPEVGAWVAADSVDDEEAGDGEGVGDGGADEDAEGVEADETGSEPPRADSPAIPGGDEPDPDEDVLSPGEEQPRPLPRVIRRLQFKADGEGYLGPRRQHLHLVTLPATAGSVARTRRLTAGPWDDRSPAWSPDGRWIAFVSKRTVEADLSRNTDVWLLPVAEGDDAADGDEPVRLTRSPGAASRPAFGPAGRALAYAYTPPDPPVYAGEQLHMIMLYGDGPAPEDDRAEELAPSEPIELTAHLDRRLAGARPVFSDDATSIYATVQDRGTVALVRVGTGLPPVGDDGGGGIGGLFRRGPRADPEDRARIEAVVAGPRVVHDFVLLPGEEPRVAVILSRGTEPAEVYETAAEPLDDVEIPATAPAAHLQPSARPPAAALRRLSSANLELVSRVGLQEPEPLRFSSDPDVFVEGWLLRPPTGREGGSLPLVVRLHGGPVAAYTWAFSFERQWLAAQGYAVLYLNPRGSSGYGLAFAESLWADWGGPDLRDVLAGIDHVASRGIVDVGRLGVGGWSYGGILTNYLVTRTDRFAAAVSGASETDAFSAYGTDDLHWWWEAELGLPYDPEARRRYEELSAIRDVEAITTPTLFMAAEEDWRVPLSQSEQMYAQLRRRMAEGGPATGLIVYPDESHSVSRPSFVIDRWLRTKAWYDRHVLGDPEADPFFDERAW